MTTLVLYSSAQRERFAAVCQPTARQFAFEAELRVCVEHQKEYEAPYMQKVRLTLAALQFSERVIYSDSDIVFRPGAGALVERLFTGPVNMSTDLHGFCTGFFTCVRTPEVEKMLRLWWELGMPIDSDQLLHDQGTFKLLNQNFQWIKDLVREIPTNLISNPECAIPGAIAHHFWSSDGRFDRVEKFSWGA